jgi:hypothetical protein
MPKQEDDLTYEQYVEVAKTAEINDVRLICTDDLSNLWHKHLPSGSLMDFADAQFEMLTSFCKKVVMADPGYSADYEELMKRSYQLFAKTFRDVGRCLKGADYALLLNEFNQRVVMNMYQQTEKGEEYDYRTLVLVVDLLPQGMWHDPRIQEYLTCRLTYESKVNLLH